jgi:hypothetical protein
MTKLSSVLSMGGAAPAAFLRGRPMRQTARLCNGGPAIFRRAPAMDFMTRQD